MTSRTSSALLALTVTLAIGPAPRASACGGFFCSSTPIVQARESVVYGLEEDGSLTMAVQIQYSGRDEDFAWILPVPVPPTEIRVGTDALFSQLETATEPTFTLGARTDGVCNTASCSYPSYGGGFGCAAEAAVDRGGFEDAGSAFRADGGAPPVTVHSQSVVGPYDTVVLGAATADEILGWLDDNGYDIPEASRPLLAPYAEQGFVFVALRLNANAESSVIRPVVMSMPTSEACLPIRLTAIASNPSLPIALYFLGDAQVASLNYNTADITPTPALFQGSLTWTQAVTNRVTELGGQAFATDYADTAPSVSLELADVSDLAEETDPQLFVLELLSRGYTSTQLLIDLIAAHVVPGSGDTPASYAACLVNRQFCSTPISFDPVGLAAAIEQEMVAPAREAQALVERHYFLTRLSTSMRQEDMTVDPIFAVDEGLPTVPRQRTGTMVTQCSSDYYQGYAPVVLETGGVQYPVTPGDPSIADDEAFCRARGGTVEGSGCSSTVGVPAPTMFLMGGALLALGVRLRRRSPRRARK